MKPVIVPQTLASGSRLVRAKLSFKISCGYDLHEEGVYLQTKMFIYKQRTSIMTGP